MHSLQQEEGGLVWRGRHETVRVEPWGADSLRLRATMAPEIRELPGALLAPAPAEATIELGGDGAVLRHGAIEAHIGGDGQVRFHRRGSDAPLLAEPPAFSQPPVRHFQARDGDLFHIAARFLADPGERLYGLGQHQHGLLDQKGCVIDLVQRNGEVCIPFLLSSRGYGFLWNNPAVGRVELAANGTRWVAEAARQIDYWITAGEGPAEILAHYADATGHAPMLPAWAAGFWQSKLRYRSQEELLAVAHEYRRRSLPLSVLVIDFMHWTRMGEWRFDPAAWPDPGAMVRELVAMGVEVMVSVWPTVNAASRHFEEMGERGLLVRTERGVAAHTAFRDSEPSGRVYLHHYDATHPEARQFLWSRIEAGYVRHGIRAFWLDACEPEIYPADHDNLRYHLGNGLEVGCLYPLRHQQAFYEGQRAAGEEEILTLCRSAWAGSQRYGAAVWSGDIPSTFAALRAQVRAGLNIGLSGIPWWTTDIGGFFGGDIGSPAFRELVVRWFQYGAFCPIFRLHGCRQPETEDTGAPNEVWSFGEEAYEILRELLFLRERLRPYLMAQMRLARRRGIPPMRPLFVDFADETCWAVDDQFLLGPALLVAPVLHEGARRRRVYLPAGSRWTDAWTEEQHEGGQWLEADAPLARIPLYLRGDARLPIRAVHASPAGRGSGGRE
jgi:alpha-D-xyloside xylohydrolase